jgi:hypothetical protein
VARALSPVPEDDAAPPVPTASIEQPLPLEAKVKQAGTADSAPSVEGVAQAQP